ncbi:hypothetical protein GCM10010495_31390 [Kitasatospora herbaricolor]|nr:hypothetical protein GCM10010495_31390 [Kitasatospora herbaricolor]
MVGLAVGLAVGPPVVLGPPVVCGSISFASRPRRTRRDGPGRSVARHLRIVPVPGPTGVLPGPGLIYTGRRRTSAQVAAPAAGAQDSARRPDENVGRGPGGCW